MKRTSSFFLCFGGVFLAACGSSDHARAVIAGPDSGRDTGGSSQGGATGTGGAPAAGGADAGVAGKGGAEAGAAGAGTDAGDASRADAALDSAAEAGCTAPALHFGADVDAVVVPSSTTMDFGAAGTLEVWILADRGVDGGIFASGSLFNKWVNFQEDKFLGVGATGGVQVFIHPSAGAIVNYTSPVGVTPGHWTHVAFAFDTTSTRTYVDGTKMSEQVGTSQAANSTGDVQIGHVTRDYIQNAVHGFYSEMRLSKVARYVADFTPQAHLVSDTDTTALWKFDEGTGASAGDSSGNANTGTITGAAWLTAPCR